MIKKRMTKKLLNVMVREGGDMKPFLLKCGLALSALTFAGFLYSRIRTKTIKPSPTSPRRHPLGHGSEVNIGGSARAASSSCSIVSDGNILDSEETCINKVIISNCSFGVSPITKKSGEKDGYLPPEFSDLVKEADFRANTSGNTYKKDVETTRSKVGSLNGSSEKDEHEQEIRQLRNMIRMLQEREQSLEVQLLEYCGIREQETAVMELQNRLKISNMEAKMFSLKVETLQSENRRLEAQVADHAKVMAELETAKTKLKHLKKKIRYEAEQNKEQIINLKQKVAKMQEQECKAAANDLDIQIKLKRLKDLESEAEELRTSNLKLHMDNSDLAQRLESTQLLAHAVLEDPEADAIRKESESLRQENEGLVKQIEQVQADHCSNVEELVYLRWINACLRHELRNYQAHPGKTAARDLSKSLSPTSEKKAKQLILEYANNDGSGGSDFDSDQWSTPQGSFVTDTGDCGYYSPHDNSSDARANTSRKSKIFSKLMKLIRGNSFHHHRRVTSREKVGSRDDSNSPHFSSISTGAEGLRSEYATPTYTSRRSLDSQRTLCMKEDDKRNSYSHAPGSSKMLSPKRKSSGDLRNNVDTFSDSPGIEKSNLVKYAEALKDSSGSGGQFINRISASYSSF